MKPIKHKKTTRELKHTLDECITLPVVDCNGVMVSYWQPSFWDRVKILFGQPVRLSVMGEQHPPVAVDTKRH